MSSNSNPNSTDYAYEQLHVVLNPDGSLTRLKEFHPIVPPTQSSDSPTLSKDVPINQEKGTWARLYLPRETENGTLKQKLPVIVFVHGGGFVVGSAALPVFHEFCTGAASELGALIVSVEYRLAPEHRLPAAYDDVFEALTWVKEATDPWVRQHGNLSHCVIIGESAGGNIAYHTGLRAADQVDHLKPLIIKGLVLVQPYFSGLHKTESERRMEYDPVLPLATNYLMWELALPIGANRGHEFCDPSADGGSVLLGRLKDLDLKVGVVASNGDPLFDRDVEVVKMMEKKGVTVRSLITHSSDKHGVFISVPAKRKELCALIREFLS